MTSPANPMVCDRSVRSSFAVAFGLYLSARAWAQTRVLVTSADDVIEHEGHGGRRDAGKPRHVLNGWRPSLSRPHRSPICALHKVQSTYKDRSGSLVCVGNRKRGGLSMTKGYEFSEAQWNNIKNMLSAN